MLMYLMGLSLPITPSLAKYLHLPLLFIFLSTGYAIFLRLLLCLSLRRKSRASSK